MLFNEEVLRYLERIGVNVEPLRNMEPARDIDDPDPNDLLDQIVEQCRNAKPDIANASCDTGCNVNVQPKKNKDSDLIYLNVDAPQSTDNKELPTELNAIAASAGRWWMAVKDIECGKTISYDVGVKFFTKQVIDDLHKIKIAGVVIDHNYAMLSKKYEESLTEHIADSISSMNLIDDFWLNLATNSYRMAIKVFCMHYLVKHKGSQDLSLRIGDITPKHFYNEVRNYLVKMYDKGLLDGMFKSDDKEEDNDRFTDIEVTGLASAIIASGYPMATKIISPHKATDEQQDKAVVRAHKLASCYVAEGHDCFLKGITVSCNVRAEQFWWQQFQRYHFADIIASQSKMHRILKFDLKQQCNSMVEPAIIKIVQDLIDDYNADEKKDPKKFEKILCNLPMGLQLTARIVTNYLQLKTMYHQRKNHRLSMWNKEFVKFIQSLPMSELITDNKSEESTGE